MAFVADNSVIVAVPSQANALTREAWLLARKEQVHVPAMWQPECHRRSDSRVNWSG